MIMFQVAHSKYNVLGMVGMYVLGMVGIHVIEMVVHFKYNICYYRIENAHRKFKLFMMLLFRSQCKIIDI